MTTKHKPSDPSFVRGLVVTGLVATSLLAAQPLLRSQEMPRTISLSTTGDFALYKKADEVKVSGALNPDNFNSEMYGQSFSVSATGLPEGSYTIEVDLAEVYHRTSGQRLMRITAGDVILADSLDIFKEAGGFAKALTIKGQIQHAADTIGGPVTIKFEALKDKAKFNAIRILNAQGQVVASSQASELRSPEDVAASAIPQVTAPVIYTNPDKPIDARVNDLISRMSLREKVQQLMQAAPAIPRLDVPEYHYWNEALHGVARAGNATVFPQAIGMAATWDEPLIHRIGETVATEARAKYLDASSKGDRGDNRGLTFWAPNINIFRDPRWGRGQETYGEDPYLTTRTGVAYIKGLQGNDPKYIKAMAAAKHFAIHSGPEPGRNSFNVNPTQRDLYETYLPQFQAAVQEAQVGSVMSAYNAINGVPASANHWLLTDLLRNRWGFKGHVVSDCGAVGYISSAHRYAASGVEGSAKAIRAGLDLECGATFRDLTKSVAQGLVSEKDIDTALHRVLSARFQLGLFDPPGRAPFSNIPMSEVESPEHLELARQTARESIVLLKNNGILPLDKTKIKKIAVIGDNANSNMMLNGNYHGYPSNPINILKGIQMAAGEQVKVEWKRGAPLLVRSTDNLAQLEEQRKQAVELAKTADVVIYVGGLNAGLEGEESKLDDDGFFHGDRITIELPKVQMQLIQALHETGKPLIFVNCSGSAVAMPWEAANLPAIVQAWYPGGEGGAAVADVLFGNFNPSGRLPITFYEKTSDLPPYTDYNMVNRTYRYFTDKPLFAFGYGLSYTSFQYAKPNTKKNRLSAKDTLLLSVPIKNNGNRDGAEVVQIYLKHNNSSRPQPNRSLIAYKRVPIARGATANIDFSIPVQQFRYWDEKKKQYAVESGKYSIEIGASSSDIRQKVPVTVKG